MERLKRSWRLFKNAFAVLRDNKKLLVFPLFVLLGCVVFALFFWGAALAAGTVVVKSSGAARGVDWSGLNSWNCAAVLVPLYLLTMFMATFFNVAFYGEIIQALNGGGVSLGRGLRLAWSKLLSIFLWSLFAGLVGYVIRSLEEQFGFVGKTVMGLVGMAWSVTSVFAIPVIIREDRSVNPLRHLKKSASVIKKTWGEALVGYVGFSSISGVLILASIGLFTVAIVVIFLMRPDPYDISAPDLPMGMIGLVACLWLLLMAAFGVLIHAAGKIYLCSLYIYASEGVVPEHFSQKDMDVAWKIGKAK